MSTQKMMPAPMAMMTTSSSGSTASTILQNGTTIIPSDTPLTRLNYFDGKFLRAVDLQKEQAYLRVLVEYSNTAGGPGVARGFSASLQSGTQILVSSGLAIDPQGRLLLLTNSQTVSIPDLLANTALARSAGAKAEAGAVFGDCVAAAADSGPTLVSPSSFYLLVIAHAEAFCGEEDVFGKLCQEACVTSTDRPYVVEGIVARLLPLTLTTPLPASQAVTLAGQHLRSRVASAYFEDERNWIGSLISKAGLQSEVWCMGADGVSGIYVPLGVVGWTGSAASFFDAWTARRERMDPPAKRYWQWRMRMRPWDVFMAQVLQFQCQLRDGLQTGPGGGTVDPCADTRKLVGEAATAMTELHRFYQAVSEKLAIAKIDATNLSITGGATSVSALIQRMSQAQAAAILGTLDRRLIRQGIVEVPSAGYLPVTPGAAMSVNDQVRQWMGEGVNLRFCIVTPDYVQHALEEAQHMERISLIAGLDDPQAKPDVDILVPNGKVVEQKLAVGTAYQAELSLFTQIGSVGGTGLNTNTGAVGVSFTPQRMSGAAFVDTPQSGKLQLFTAMDQVQDGATTGSSLGLLRSAAFRNALAAEAAPINIIGGVARTVSESVWLAATCNPNPFSATSSGQALVEVRSVFGAVLGGRPFAEDILLNGNLQFERPIIVGFNTLITGMLNGTFSRIGRSGATTTEQNGRMSVEVKALLRVPPNQAPSLQVTFINRNANLIFELRASWSGSPRKIVVDFTESSSVSALNAARGTTSTAQVQFLQSDDVLLPANVRHAEALKALDNIGQALADPQFAPASSALLFPPPPPPTGDLQVEATLDWVLFHRRRTKQCQPEKVTTIVPSRRYQLWHGLVANADALKATIAALHSKAPFDRQAVAFQRVDVPEFAPGIATLLSQRGTIQTDWTNVKPGQVLAYGGIASTDAAKVDGNTLALARLNELEQTIQPISQPTPTTITEVLDAIHPDLAVPGVDGVIVVLTIVEKVSHIVYEVSSDALLKNLIAAVSTTGSTINLTTELTRSQATFLGTVIFKLKTADVQGDSMTPVVTAFKNLNVAAPGSAATFSLAGDAADLVTSRIDQANAILAALGAPATIVSSPEPSQQSLGLLAPTVTVVVPGLTGVVVLVHGQPDATPVLTGTPVLVHGRADVAPGQGRVARLVPWRRNRLDRTIVGLPAPQGVRFQADGSLPAGLSPDLVTALQRAGTFISVELATVETRPDGAAQKRLDNIAEALLQAKLIPVNASRTITTIKKKEKPLLTEGGINADEIVFLRVG